MMQSQDSHLSDQELILAADGELTARDASRVETHLAACWTCRARKQEIEATIGELVRVHRRNVDGRLPPPEGPRAQLKAQIAQLTDNQLRSSREWLPAVPWRIASAIAAAGLLLFAIGYFVVQRWA